MNEFSLIDAIYELKYNPFEYGSYIASFYTTVTNIENNVLIASLIIPLCSHPVYGGKIFHSSVRSSIWTIFKERKELYDLQERVDAFKSLTENSIYYCLINEWLSFNERSLSFNINDKKKSEFDKQKVAEKLGSLFSGQSVIDIYSVLGVKIR